MSVWNAPLPSFREPFPDAGETDSIALRGRQEGRKGFPKASRSRKTRRLNPMNKERYKTRKEIADIFGVGVRTVSYWMQEGCPVFYTGRKLRPGRGCHPLFIVEELEKWLIEQAEEQRGEKRRKDRDVMSSFSKKS